MSWVSEAHMINAKFAFVLALFIATILLAGCSSIGNNTIGCYNGTVESKAVRPAENFLSSPHYYVVIREGTDEGVLIMDYGSYLLVKENQSYTFSCPLVGYCEVSSECLAWDRDSMVWKGHNNRETGGIPIP